MIAICHNARKGRNTGSHWSKPVAPPLHSTSLRLVLQQGLRLAVLGVVLGLAGALSVTHLLASFLYGVSPFDLGTFAGVSLLLALVTLLACLVPARRAARVDPLVALRYE
ncbi:MAG: hypothetical protein ABSF95_00125 [Verrucomicrobiota bacterium]